MFLDSLLQFSGDRAFVCVERDLFCAILRLHPPHLSGGHISEQDTQSHHCCLAKPLNVFHRGARTTCRSLLLTVPQLFLFAFSSLSATPLCPCIPAPDVSQLNLNLHFLSAAATPSHPTTVCPKKIHFRRLGRKSCPHMCCWGQDTFITVNKQYAVTIGITVLLD